MSTVQRSIAVDNWSFVFNQFDNQDIDQDQLVYFHLYGSLLRSNICSKVRRFDVYLVVYIALTD
jgi:hypothetical protein